MKSLFIAIILFPALAFGQQRCCFQNLTPFSALSIQANTLTDTRIDVRWDDVQADSYAVTRNGTPVSGSPFSASITSISETGLTVNTQYIYKVTAYKNGYLASFNSDTTNTLSFSPSFMALFATAVASNYNTVNGGTQRTYTNQGGTTTGNSGWVTVKSLVGNNYISYPGASVGFQPGMRRLDAEQMLLNSVGPNLTPPGSNFAPPYSFNSTITLSGDFTILWSERAPIGPSGQQLFGDGVNNLQYSQTSGKYHTGGADYSAAWPGGSHATGTQVMTLGIRRSGAFVSSYDGTSWSTGVACPTTTLTINQHNMIVDVPGYYHGFCIVAAALSANQAAEFFNIWQRKAYISTPDTAPTPTGLNFATTLSTGGTGNYLSYAWMAYGPFGGGYKTVNSVTQGDYTFFAAQALPNPTYKMGNRIFVIRNTDHKLSDPIDLGYYTYDYDSVYNVYDQFGHITPTLLCYDNRLHVYQYYPHYDQFQLGQQEIRRTAPNFNFASMQKWNPWKGQSTNNGRYLAYPRINRYGDKLVKVSADLNTGFVFHQPSMEISTDNMNSWDFEQIFDNYGANADMGNYMWSYPYLIQNGGTNDKIIILCNFLVCCGLTTPYVGWAICYADASAPHIIKNWDNTFSKDISNRNPITWAEMKAHYIFTLGTHGLQSLVVGPVYNGATTYTINDIVRVGSGSSTVLWRSKHTSNAGNTPAENTHWTQTNNYENTVNTCYMDSSGEIFGLTPDYVNGDGYLSMFYGTPGGTMTFKPSFNFNLLENGNYRVQIVKEGVGYSVYGINKATPGQVVQWTTTTASKGTAWTSIGVISDGTHSHDVVQVNENHAFTGIVNVMSAWSTGGTPGTTPWQLWIK